MPQVVTELVVDDSGSLRVLGEFERGMEGAGQAAVRSTGALDRFNAAQAKVAQATARGLAVTTQSIERRSAEQRALERWQSTVDKTMGLEIRLRREAERAAIDMSNAVTLGYTTPQEAVRTLTALEARHSTELMASTVAAGKLAASQGPVAAAIDKTASSVNRLAVANDNAMGSTANIAAQFQDIGVTAAMGMNPIMIALQQGTQLSAVLNTMKNPVMGLATAFMSIINPVSLLTIGFVALGAAAIQWFMSTQKSAEDASTALERHNKWLDETLKGYDEMRAAAKAAGDEASKLPEAIVKLELARGLREQADEMKLLGDNIDQVQTGLRETAEQMDMLLQAGGGQDMGIGKYIEQVKSLADLDLGLDTTAKELEAAAIAAHTLYDASDDPRIQEMADQVYKLAQQLMGVRARVEETSAALSYGFQDLSGMQSFSQISQELTGWQNQLRAAAEAAAWAIANSGSAATVAASQYGTATGAANAYANALFTLGSMIPQVAAQQAAMAGMARAEAAHGNAVKASNDLLRLGTIGRAEYNERVEETSLRLTQAKDAISGVTALEERLASVTTQNTLESMTGREQALARQRAQSADTEKEIRRLADTGADQAKVDALLAQNSDQLAVALSNTNAQFDRTAASSGGAGGGIKAAGAAAKAAEKDFNSFASTADGFAEKLFPAEFARKEAAELTALLNQYRNTLDSFQIAGVEKEIADLGAAADLGLRNLTEKTKESGDTMANTLFETLGSALSEIFKGGIENADDLFEHLASGFSGIADQNFQSLFGGMGGQQGGAGAPNAVQDAIGKATEKGASNGIFAGFDAWFGKQTGQNGAGAGSTLLGAAAGGFATGYAAQDPVMGTIGGALQGAGAGMAFGPIGAGIGAVVGGLFAMFGAASAAAKALKEAKENLAKLKGEIDNLLDVGEGRGVGEATKAFRDFYKKSYEFQEAAMKAQDSALQKRLQNAVNSFFTFLNTDFKLSFQGTIDALKSGEGLGGAFVSAQQEIIGMREELKSFVADTQFMNEKFGELAMIDWAKETAAAVAEAQKATQAYALTVLAGAYELSEFEEGVAEANGRASALQVTLEQLGMSATDAAGAITGALNMALAKLKDEYLADVNSSINDLSGFGWLNKISEAQKTYQDRLRDSAALGLDGSLALRELNLSLADIVQGAGLSADTLAMLGDAFPMLAGLLDTIAGKDAMATVADARAELQQAYDAEAAAINDVISRTERFIETIKNFRDGMRLDASSPLGPEQKLMEAQRQYRETLALANGGDEAAMGRLTDVSQAYLDEARAYYASTDQYVAIWEEVDRTLAATQGNAVTQLDVARSQLNALNASVAGILDLNVNVKTVAEALMGFMGAQAASDAALKAQIAAMANAGANTVQELYKSVLGRSGSAAEIGWWTSSGKSMSQIEKDIVWAKQHGAMADGGIVGRFQAGGMVGNGVYNVDSVLARYAGGGNIALAGGEHVTRATSVNSATMPVLAHINRTGQTPGNDNGDVVAELRALRQDNASLVSAVARLAQTIGLSDQETRNLIREGNEIQSDTSSALKRVARS